MAAYLDGARQADDPGLDFERLARMTTVDTSGIGIDRPIRRRKKRPLIWHIAQLTGALAIAGLVYIALWALPS